MDFEAACCIDFETAISAFSEGEGGSSVAVRTTDFGMDFKVLERANPYSGMDFLGTEIEADCGGQFGVVRYFSLGWKCV
jgi:hypothetical protein